MLLQDLIRECAQGIDLCGVPNQCISGVCEDSRQVLPGHVFVARAGAKTDGRCYVLDAVGRGAVAVVAQEPMEGCAVPVIIVKDVAAAVSQLAQTFYGRPSRSVKVLGITGTNGKTTTTFLIHHILEKAGIRCGLIGTVTTNDGNRSQEASMTTPGGVELARLLASMRDNGMAACAMEASSHALDQRRTAGVRFAAGAFTNLTWEHLDYHKDMERYAAAKARLFESLDRSAVALVNGDDQWSSRMIEKCAARVVRWGFGADCHYRAEQVRIDAEGSHFVLATPHGSVAVNMQLIGRHNIANALTALAVVGETWSMAPDEMARSLADAKGAPGRLEPVRMGQPFGVFVDYAHTDDGLKNVLLALRPLTSGKLRVVFGCGGDRDRAKRPKMAKVAESLADTIYVTSDNPRTEQPGAIIGEILTGLARVKPVMVEADRRRAIRQAIGDARPGDVVLLAGKGHENYQIVGTEKRHFDDVEEARAALAGGCA
jgi:UDP-N-acetylmuramoyl-L-alanyl-D-glutamate--2,6-diaminopimelate ligase